MPKCTFCNEIVPLGTTQCPACGAPIKSAGHVDVEPKLQALLDQGEKLAAIKLYKEQTGSSLLEAKNAVDALEAGEKLSVPSVNLDTDLERELLLLLGKGQKIEAVKLYREKMGGELVVAKRAVETLAAKHGVAETQSIGCMGLVFVILFLALIAGAVWFLLLR